MDDDDCPWPPDTERRRKLALEIFYKKNPSYQDSRDEILPPPKVKKGGRELGYQAGTRPRRSGVRENRWDHETTMELLEAMKSYVRMHQLRSIGVDLARWKTVAKNLTNPCGLDENTFARSCQVRYDNLRRNKTGMRSKVMRLSDEITKSLEEFFELCKENMNMPPRACSGLPPLPPSVRNNSDLTLISIDSDEEPMPDTYVIGEEEAEEEDRPDEDDEEEEDSDSDSTDDVVCLGGAGKLPTPLPILSPENPKVGLPKAAERENGHGESKEFGSGRSNLVSSTSPMTGGDGRRLKQQVKTSSGNSVAHSMTAKEPKAALGKYPFPGAFGAGGKSKKLKG